MNKLLLFLSGKIVEGLIDSRLAERITDAIKNEINFALVEVSRTKVKPGDTLILRHRGILSDRESQYLIASMKDIFPNNKIIVLEDDMNIDVLEP